MSKLVLSEVPNGVSNTVTNTNFDKIKNELNNNTLKRRTEAGEDNTVHTDIDMNSNRIYNLPKPESEHEPLRRKDVSDAISATEDARDAANKANEAVDRVDNMEEDFQNFLLSSGYQDLGDYEAGLEITARNQIFRKDGELYRASASLELPYTTTGNWSTEGDLFVSVGDAALRQELAQPDGAGKVGYLGATVADALYAVPSSLPSDGNTDATLIIQEAIDGLPDGGVLMVKPGVYKVSKNTALPDYPYNDQPCLNIRGKKDITLKLDGVTFYVEEHAQGILEIIDSENILVEGGTFLGPGNFPPLDGNTGRGEKGYATGGYQTSGFWGYYKNNSHDTSSDSRGGFGGNFPQYGGGTASTWGMWNGGFIGNNGSGLLIVNSKNVTVLDSFATGFNYSGFRCGFLSMQDIENNPNNLNDGIRFIRCRAEGNYEVGISVYRDTHNVVVDGCVMDKTGHPNATLHNDQHDPGYGFATTGINNRDIKVVNSTARDNVRKGIDFHSGQRINCSGNYVENCWVSGIFTSYTGDRVTRFINITNNIVRNCSYTKGNATLLGDIYVTGLTGSTDTLDYDGSINIQGNNIEFALTEVGIRRAAAINTRRLHNVSVIGNRVKSSYTGLEYIGFSKGNMENNLRGIIVIGNIIDSLGDSLIQISYCDSPVVTGNKAKSIDGSRNSGQALVTGNSGSLVRLEVADFNSDGVVIDTQPTYKGIRGTLNGIATVYCLIAKATIEDGVITDYSCRTGKDLFRDVVLGGGTNSLAFRLKNLSGTAMRASPRVELVTTKNHVAKVTEITNTLCLVRICDLVTGEKVPYEEVEGEVTLFIYFE